MNEEFSVRKIAEWGFVIALGSVVLVASLVGVASRSALKHESEGADAVAARILPVARVKIGSATGAATQARTGEATFAASCSACHSTGAAGAPKIGDNAAWAPRLKLGLSGLVKSAMAGKNAMPPKGGSDASEADLARAIVYMTNKSGAKFAEPK